MRRLALPQLFLGLLSLAIAAVLVAHTIAGTLLRARHAHDTVTVTGSARRPIAADLVQWRVTVTGSAADPAGAARELHDELGRVRAFLVRGGVPAAAISASVVTSDVVVEKLPRHRVKRTYEVAQSLAVQTRELVTVQAVSARLGDLIEQGIDVSADPPAWISTELAAAKLDALQAATVDARRRAQILVDGLGGKLGRVRASSLGVYQVTPRYSNDVTDYGVNDVSSREKDVNAVVSVTFDVRG